jgi:hypothetical protein
VSTNDAATIAAEGSLGQPKKRRVVPGNWMRNIWGQRRACGESVVLRFLAASIRFVAISLVFYLILVMGQGRPFLAQQAVTQHEDAKRFVDEASSGVGRLDFLPVWLRNLDRSACHGAAQANMGIALGLQAARTALHIDAQHKNEPSRRRSRTDSEDHPH